VKSGSVRNQSAFLLAAAFIVVLGCACQDANPEYLAADRSTQPGERLWLVQISSPGLGPDEIDSLVADPLIRAITKDFKVEVAATISRYEHLDIYLRAPVHLSSVLVVSLAVGAVSLPTGTLQPTLEAAGPPPPPKPKIRIELDNDRLNAFGLTLTQVLLELRGHPELTSNLSFDALANVPISATERAPVLLRDLATLRSEPSRLDRPRLDWIVRLEAKQLAEIDSLLDKLLEDLSDGPKPAGNLVRIPELKSTVRIEPDSQRLRAAGLTVLDAYQAFRTALGDEHLVWPQMNVTLQLASLPTERLGDILVVDQSSNLVPLKHFVSLTLSLTPDQIIRIGQNTYAGFLLVNHVSEQRLRESLRKAGISLEAMKKVPELSDAERALLGWPVPND
jgi:hypothetical protein